MKFTESTLKSYAAPLSNTENEMCKRTIEAIRDTLTDLGYTADNKNPSLLESGTIAYSISMRNIYSSEKIHIFIQGSYANNTCVRNESDVDIAVVREDLYEYANGSKFISSSAWYKKDAMFFKNIVENTLKRRFSSYQVHRGNKSIKVDGNTYRKKADVVPCISLNYHYQAHSYDSIKHYEGVTIYADDGTVINNFPKQHIANGKAKNISTNFYYKKMVRIMKKIRYLMSEKGYSSADKVSSFGVESLLWNIPDSYFMRHEAYGFKFLEIVSYVFYHKDDLLYYYEANGIKKLCPTQEDINYYSIFIDDLYLFYKFDYNS